MSRWWPRLRLSVAAGVTLFAIHYSGVLHGIWSPPEGYQPTFLEQTLDSAAYLSWLADSADHWLLPNRHVPYITEPALLQPMVLLIGKTAKFTGMPAIGVYYALQVLLYIAAVYTLLFCAATFLPKANHRVAAGIVVLCSIPMAVGPETTVAFAYQSADGLFRGGLSNGPNLTFGTLTMLAAFAFLGRFVQWNRAQDFGALCCCAFINALVHPFELYVFVTASIAALGVIRFRQGRFRTILGLSAALIASAALGMLPYLIQTARTQWLRDASDANQFTLSPFLPLLYFGLPSLTAIYLLLMRFRAASPTDVVVQCWVLTSYSLLLCPAIPASVHLLDGFVYGQAFLIVRWATQDEMLQRIFGAARRPAFAAASMAVVFSAASLASMWIQIYQDGNSPSPKLLNAIESRELSNTLAWLKLNAPKDSLVLAPSSIAPRVAALGLNAYGSHDVLSLQFSAQSDQIEKFYSNQLTPQEAQAFLRQYGFRFVISNGLQIQKLPYAHMNLYPNTGLIPATGRNGVRTIVLNLISSLLPQLRPS